MCPSCTPSKNSFFANFGEDRLKAMQSIIEQRRKASKVEKTKGWGWFKESSLKTKIRGGTSLNELKLDGYLPENFIEESIKWKSLSTGYTLDELYDFGVRWLHMIHMGFCADDFKLFEQPHYLKLGINSSKMLETSMSIHQLINLKIPLHRLHEMHFTWEDLTRMGGNCETLRGLSDSMCDIKTYFEPTSWLESGFTPENIEKYKWQALDRSSVRQKREISVGGIVF